jgi:hypothetical protein
MAFDNMAIWEFYSLLRCSIIGAKSAALLKMLVNEQSITINMGRMPAEDWKQWAILNAEAAEPAGWGSSMSKPKKMMPPARKASEA